MTKEEKEFYMIVELGGLEEKEIIDLKKYLDENLIDYEERFKEGFK